MAAFNKHLYILSLLCLFLSLEGATPKAKKTPFADLDSLEMYDVLHYLYRQSELNVARVFRPQLQSSFIYLVETLRPPKKDVLGYLDAYRPLPQRAARAIIIRGDLPIPVIEEYKVFPVPNPKYHQRIINPKWRNPIPATARPPFTIPQVSRYSLMLRWELSKINGLLGEVTGLEFYTNCTIGCLLPMVGHPPNNEPDHHQTIFHLVKNVEGQVLHPIGLQFVVNMDSLNGNEWSVEHVWFQGQSFRDFDHLLEAKSRNELMIYKVPDPYGMGTTNLSSSLNFRGEPRPEKPAHGPRSYMPNGNRFTVSDRRIKWLGWEFEFSMLTSTGFQIYDVKFLNERIAYELSLQEIAVFYSGPNPWAQHTSFYDSYTLFGVQTSELFTGIDCPFYAKFFDFVHHAYGEPRTFKNGACLFEQDLGTPLRRHYAPEKMSQGIPDNVLVFRHILTVYNYDYIVDFIFHQGGQIEVKVSLSGYVVNTFYKGPEMDAYGYVINIPTAMGVIHHHAIHMKVDLDILGPENRFQTLDISIQEEPDILNNGSFIYNRYFNRSLKTTEKEATYQFNFDTPKYLIISSEKHNNSFNNSRGYRILTEGMSKMLLPDDYRGARSRSWTKYQVAVTKQKDEESSSSSVYATMEPFDPVMSFQDFIDDDENIVDEDLVAWITLGTHHIPHSEDVPIVSTPGVQLRFFLLPYNFFDEDPSLASRDNLRTMPDGKGGHRYQYSGFDDTQPTTTTSGVWILDAHFTFYLMLIIMIYILV